MKIAIITACPSGVANSIIAAGVLEKALQSSEVNSLQLDASIECQSVFFNKKPLTQSTIDQAEVILIATNTPIDTTRFIGKKVYQSNIELCLANANEWIKNGIESAIPLTAQDTQQSVQLSQDHQSEALVSATKKIVAVTACPTGVAHTFMAAEALEDIGAKLGHQVKVERRGSVGAKNELTEQDIADADLVIIAADIDVPMARFVGKPLYKTGTGIALKQTEHTIYEAISTAQPYNASRSQESSQDKDEKKGVYKHLMTGVSHMLPLIVAGGLMIAISFMFGIKAFEVDGSLAQTFKQIGDAAFGLMIPILAGYIAYSIADRPGLAPGLVGGALAASISAGFLGGIAAGFIAGYAAKSVNKYVQLPQSMEALKPILIIPLIATLITGFIMLYVVGAPIAYVMAQLTEFLTDMRGANAILLGLLLGGMMCFDLGGPINKVAYTFGTGLLATQVNGPMAAIMAAGMVPAMGMGLATFLARKKFIKTEQEAGKASFVLGMCFISEGAIPFAAKDPMHVIPCCVAGGALTGALSMFFNAQLLAPHGGLFVLLIPNAITPVLPYLFAIIAGTVVTGLSYALVKKAEAVKV